MLDQAYKLRELIQSVVPVVPASPDGLPMIVVSGGRSSVGTTTVAVNLAAVLADIGERVVLVDAAKQNVNAAHVAGINARIKLSLHDVLSGGCRAADALVLGPAGVMLLPNDEARANTEYARHAQQKLLSELATLSRVASLLVVDCGSGLTPWVKRFWSRARLVVLVTTPEDSALLGSYTAIKRSVRDSVPTDLRLLVNQCDSERCANDVYGRLSAACERFLARPVEALPAMPRYHESTTGVANAVPRVWESPNSSFGHAMLWLGRAVHDQLQLLDSGHQALQVGTREFSRC